MEKAQGWNPGELQMREKLNWDASVERNSFYQIYKTTTRKLQNNSYNPVQSDFLIKNGAQISRFYPKTSKTNCKQEHSRENQIEYSQTQIQQNQPVLNSSINLSTSNWRIARIARIAIVQRYTLNTCNQARRETNRAITSLRVICYTYPYLTQHFEIETSASVNFL